MFQPGLDHGMNCVGIAYMYDNSARQINFDRCGRSCFGEINGDKG